MSPGLQCFGHAQYTEKINPLREIYENAFAIILGYGLFGKLFKLCIDANMIKYELVLSGILCCVDHGFHRYKHFFPIRIQTEVKAGHVS